MKLTEKDITQAVKSSVDAYLMARAYAETMRGKVDAVYKETLEIFPLYTDLERSERRGGNDPLERIYSQELMFLSEDEETCQDVYKDVNFQLRKNGSKPATMPDSNCPALTAEHLQSKTEWVLIDSAAEMLGENGDFRHKLLCNGMKAYKKFIDLVVRLVVSLPDFKNPLTGQEV